MSRPNRPLIAAAVAATLFAAGTAHAAVITFGTDALDHLASTGTHTEDGFDYTAAGTGWELQTARSNPGAALATFFNVEGSQPGDLVEILRTGGGTFTFTSIDWSTFGSMDSDDVEVRGFLGAALVGTLSLSGSNMDWTTAAGFAGSIDRLHIVSMAGSVSNAMALDNVVLDVGPAAVPEPGALGLAGAGLAVLALARRRRR